MIRWIYPKDDGPLLSSEVTLESLKNSTINIKLIVDSTFALHKYHELISQSSLKSSIINYNLGSMLENVEIYMSGIIEKNQRLTKRLTRSVARKSQQQLDHQ